MLSRHVVRCAVLTVLVHASAIASVAVGQHAQSVRTQHAAVKSPVGPRESVPMIAVAPGFRIELAASEPQVVDPVAIRFDERGRMWVAEMRDYPHGPKPGEPPASVIKRLEDRDGDGFFETSRVFADQLLFANGIQPWRTGVLATVGGRVVYLPDDDDDGKADRIEAWYQGFAEENSQLRANHPTLAIDNQVYVANGLRGGKVIDARSPEAKAVPISGMDFRFDPRSGEYEAVSGVGQFGLTFDDDGRRFVCSNRNPLKQIVIPNRYLRRSSSPPPAQVAHDVAAAGAESRVYPISRAWTTSTLHAGQFTAACGVTLYGGDLLTELRGDGFTCDPTGNLVHRETMTPSGGSFRGKPAYDDFEFIASPDEWFRPVNLEVGPDGALYLVDMYRAVIEHPQFVPAELKNRPDQRYGDSLGRIYRIVPENAEQLARTRFDQVSREQTVALLDHRNSWVRDTAARLILQAEDSDDEELLAGLMRDATPRGWARALWLLAGREQLSEVVLIQALTSSSPTVQLQALRLAEQRESVAVRAAMRRLADSSDSQVRFQLALSLTPAGSGDVDALSTIAVSNPADVWTRRAVALAAGEQIEAVAVAVLGELLNRRQLESDGSVLLVADLVENAARRSPKSIRLRKAVQRVAGRGAVSLETMRAMVRGAARGKVGLPQLMKEDESFAKSIEDVLDDARRLASDNAASANTRATAIELLGAHAALNLDSRRTLQRLAQGENADQATQTKALAALTSIADDAFASDLLEAFASQSPAMRRATMDFTLARSSRIELLLERVEKDEIKIGEIDRVRTNRLLKIRTQPLKQRIAKAFAAAIPQDRKKVLAEYQPVLSLKANPQQGELVFRKNCATCHRVGKWGVDVAPDIADSRTRQPAQLLTDILQPNRAIDSNYVSYTVITTDGRSLTGVLDVETSDSITLKMAEGKRRTLARDEIDEIRSNGVSLMPEGLEKNISPQQMADLISFIKNWRYLDGKTPYSTNKR